MPDGITGTERDAQHDKPAVYGPLRRQRPPRLLEAELPSLPSVITLQRSRNAKPLNRRFVAEGRPAAMQLCGIYRGFGHILFSPGDGPDPTISAISTTSTDMFPETVRAIVIRRCRATQNQANRRSCMVRKINAGLEGALI